MVAPAVGQSRKRMLRIASGCKSLDEFVTVFRPFCASDSIFIATKSPRQPGLEIRFSITLADGKQIIGGTGRIAEAYDSKDNAHRRPGMLLHFRELDSMSRIVVEELCSEPSVTSVAPAPTAAEGTSESRIAGAAMVLPANPFGELADTSLQAFVDCMIYEESGETDALHEPSGAVPEAVAPELTPTPRPMPGLGVEADGGEAWPPASRPPPLPPPVPQPGIARPAALPVAGEAPSLGARLRRDWPRERWWPFALAATGVVLGLVLGFVMWGGDGDEVALAASAPSVAEPAAAATPSRNDGEGDRGENAATNVDVEGDAELDDDDAELEVDEAGDADDAELEADEADEAGDDGAKDELAVEDDATVAAVELAAATNSAADEQLDGDSCRVELASSPEGAEVFLEGERLGTTPSTVDIPCGEHALSFRRPRYASETREFQVEPGEIAALSVDLARPTFRLRVLSRPNATRVTIDRRRLGKSPASARVRGFEKVSVVVERPGYRRWKKRVYLTGDKTLKVTLRPATRRGASRTR